LRKKIFQKFNITEEVFKNSTEVTYKDDETIKKLKFEMKEGFDKAATGTPPDPETEIPDFLTPEKTLEIVKKIMMASTERF